MSVAKDDRHFDCEVDEAENSIQVNVINNGFNVDICKPWDGDSKTGFGRHACLEMRWQDMQELHDWLGLRLAEFRAATAS